MWPENVPLTVVFGFSVLIVQCRAPTPKKYDCPLDSGSAFSFVVQVWDEQKQYRYNFVKPGRATFGLLLTYRTVLAPAWYYLDVLDSIRFLSNYSRFKVYGQNIWDVENKDGFKNPCYQSRTVESIHAHPKARVNGDRLFFDYALLVMDLFFIVSSPTFPSIFFPIVPLSLLMAIRYVNVAAKDALCSLPLPKDLEQRDWTFNERIDVSSIPFFTHCSILACQQKPGTTNDLYTHSCIKKMKERVHGSVLCIKPEWTQNLEIPQSTTSNMLAGIPLICDGSTIGMTTQLKRRRDLLGPKQDFFFVITLLRVFPWLMQAMQDNSLLDNAYVEEDKLQSVSYPTPSKLPTEDFGHGNFFRLSYDELPFKHYSVASRIVQEPPLATLFLLLFKF